MCIAVDAIATSESHPNGEKNPFGTTVRETLVVACERIGRDAHDGCNIRCGCEQPQEEHQGTQEGRLAEED